MGKVIFLNGASSSGKTSIAREIQHLSMEPWLYVSMDNFIDMLPLKFIGNGKKAHEGYYSFTDINDGKTNIVTHPLGEIFFSNIPKITAILAETNNIIIDEVILREELLKTYIKELSDFKVYFIGVHCELAEMQRREKHRDDRVVGLALSQIDIVHSGSKTYDLEVDTTNITSNELANKVLNFIDANPNPQGFEKIKLK